MAGVRNVLLANHLRHAGTHNKVQEEREMWRLRKMEINNSLHHTLAFDNRESRAPLTRGRLLSDSYPDERVNVRDEVGGVVEDERGGVRGSERPAESKSSYYWTRQLMKVEEADTHRWGHGGYKEHHPEEFVSTDDDITEGEKKHKTINGHHQTRNERKRKKKEKKRKKVKLKKHGGSSDSDASSDDASPTRRRRLKEKRTKKKKHK